MAGMKKGLNARFIFIQDSFILLKINTKADGFNIEAPGAPCLCIKKTLCNIFPAQQQECSLVKF